MSEKRQRNSVHARRAIAYIVLILISFLCLFWFYVLFINATRSNGELGKGFTAIPSTHLIENLTNLFKGTLPVLRGMLNSLIIAALSAACCTYFSTMTAYSIHAYDYAGRKAFFTFILAIMMIPTQVTALGFVKLIQGMNLENNYIPLIVPSIAAPVTFFYLKQYMDSNLPGELIEAARIDGAGKLKQILYITLPMLRPMIILLLLLSIGRIFNSDFGLFYQVTLNSGRLYKTTQTIDTYVYRALMEMNNVGMSSAASVFQAIIGFVLVLLSNLIVRRIDPQSALF